MPEQTLSSYSAGPAAFDGGVVVATQRAIQLDGGIATTDRLPLPEPPRVDAGAIGRDAGAAAARPRLECRPECECEQHEGQDFMFCDTEVIRAVAVDRCGDAGGELVSIEGAVLNAWLSQQMAAIDADDFWTAGTDTTEEGVWRWDDGRIYFEVGSDASGDLAFEAWADEQPNDLMGEDCMRSREDEWLDLDCTETIAYACEQSPVSEGD
jgi:lectin-like protein